MLVALLVQFGLGMYVNLYATIPLNHPGHGASNYLAGTFRSVTWAETSPHAPLILAIHAGLGLLLVVGSLWLAIVALRARRRAVTWAAVLGALRILGAGFNGGSFLDYNKEFSSFVMALLFAAAVLCYGVVLSLPQDMHRPSPQAEHLRSASPAACRRGALRSGPVGARRRLLSRCPTTVLACSAPRLPGRWT